MFEWFQRHGGLAVRIGRLVPAVCTLISVPAGITDMSPARFLAYSAAGTGAGTAFLAGAGRLLCGNCQAVSGWPAPVTCAVVGTVIAIYLYRLATFRR